MKIVCITACPTGIAHTFMAAESLEKTAKKLNYEIKVETQGIKVENELTADDIKDADVVILAVDKKVGMDRFKGKPVLKVSTKDAIKDPEKIIQQALNGEGIFVYSNDKRENGNNSSEKKGIYGHLMTGVNFMLPFVIAGGILIAFSFAFGIYSEHPLAVAFSRIGGDMAFSMMVPVLAAGIAYSIAGKSGIASGMIAGLLADADGSGFLGGLVGGLFAGYLTYYLINKIKVHKSVEQLYNLIAVPVVSVMITGFAMIYVIGIPIEFLLNTMTNFLNGLDTTSGVLFGLLIGIMMAADMGGPINKAISTFCIGLMSTGVNAPIAACMAAGMTPPLGLALATLLFKNKFTDEERTAGKSCWVLGASYITEGAIPFAVSDPFRVIPSLMAGSAVAGAISLGAGVTSLAPHGGIWVMFVPNVIGNLGMYLVAIAAGTIVTATCVGLFKKNITEE